MTPREFAELIKRWIKKLIKIIRRRPKPPPVK